MCQKGKRCSEKDKAEGFKAEEKGKVEAEAKAKIKARGWK